MAFYLIYKFKEYWQPAGWEPNPIPAHIFIGRAVFYHQLVWGLSLYGSQKEVLRGQVFWIAGSQMVQFVNKLGMVDGREKDHGEWAIDKWYFWGN